MGSPLALAEARWVAEAKGEDANADNEPAAAAAAKSAKLLPVAAGVTSLSRPFPFLVPPLTSEPEPGFES